MAAFERILSGIEQMDEALDNIRLGDNVVWQVTNLKEFSYFVTPYVKQAIQDKRNLIYVRFATHPPLVKKQEGVKIVRVPLSHRFENFTVEIHNLIEREGFDAFYVFDCLSELQTAWSTDLMMGNFFRVTCPFLFQLDTVAYFPIIRGMHSFQAVAQIRDTTQLFLDVCDDDESLYVRPLKVWNRYSETMFLPHLYQRETGDFTPLTEGVKVSRFFDLMNKAQASGADQNMDSWDRFFALAQQMHAQGMDVSDACFRMCDMMMTRDKRLRALVKENFLPEDYFAVRSRMIGTGMIGGKACGMLLARKLIENNRADLFLKLEPHDSYYIGSDVFYAYIVHNDFWDIRIRQHSEKEYFSLAGEFAECLKSGEFPEREREQFKRLIDYYGQNPIIVRSSSILEDGFGNAFAGKYESVFCANSGTPEQRLREFESAVRTVYASTMSASALDYRLRRGLENRDEQMAVLVQRVSGSRFENFFLPCAAGVGYSYSPYRFLESLDPNAGMLRLVMGLGTGAVDRTPGSYPRLISLDKPLAVPASATAQKHRYSQQKIDVINTVSGQVEHRELYDILPKIPAYVQRVLLEHDYEAEAVFRDRGQTREILFISCEGLVRMSEFAEMMRECMQLIQEAYQYPVDIEYTVNVSESGEFAVNLLQCRPLQVAKEGAPVHIPENLLPDELLLDLAEASMGLSCSMAVDLIVVVDPKAYFHMDYQLKSTVAQAIGKINRTLRDKGKRMVLFVPGRIGTSSPELGVPTTFADISEFDAIFEISDSRAGYLPELSYGSHIFQDLVEANILYGAVFENEKTKRFCLDRVKQLPNQLSLYCREADSLSQILGVYDVSGRECFLYHDMGKERLCLTLKNRGKDFCREL